VWPFAGAASQLRRRAALNFVRFEETLLGPSRSCL